MPFSLNAQDILRDVERLTDRKAPLQLTQEWLDLLQAAVDGLNASEFVKPSFRFLVQRKLLIQLLVETVETNDVIRRYPGALSISITRPVFVVGPGCHDSVFLQRLLCVYPDVHYATLDKLRSVSLGLTDNAKYGSASEWPESVRIAMTTVRCHDACANDEPTDCSELMTKYLFLRVYGSYLCDYRRAFEQYLTCKEFVTYAYEMYKQDLQLMFYINKEFESVDASSLARFVFSSSHHCAFLDVVSTVFHDAVIVQLHRHPVDTIEMLLSSDNESKLGVGMTEFARNVLDWLDVVYQQMIQRSKKWSKNQGSGRRVRVIDIKSQDMDRDPIGVSTKVAESLGWERNEKVDAKIRDRVFRMKGERRSVETSVLWELSNYDVTAKEICRRFKKYCDYYNL